MAKIACSVGRSTYYKAYIEYTYEQSTSDNTSTVTASLKLEQLTDYYDFDTVDSVTVSFNMGGYSISKTGRINIDDKGNKGSVFTLASGTKTFTHDDNGKQSISFSCNFSIDCNGWGPGKISLSSTLINLTDIPRAATISKITNTSGTTISSINVGNKINVYYTPKSTDYYHKLVYYIGSTQKSSKNLGKPSSTSTKSSQSDTIDASWLSSSTSGTLSCRLYTYSDSGYSKQIGNYATKDITVNVPNTSTYNPSISIGVDSSTYGHSLGSFYVQGYSKIKLKASCSAGTGASIKSKGVVISGPSITNVSGSSGTLTTSEFTLNNSGQLKYSASITDSRNRTNSNSTTITVLSYSKPSYSKMSVIRCDDNGNALTSGNRAKCTITGTITSLNSKNSQTVSVKYRQQGNTTWNDFSTSSESSETSHSFTLKNNNVTLKTDKAYEFQFTIKDKLSNTPTTTVVVQSVSRPFNIARYNNGVAVGKFSTVTSSSASGKFECAWAANFDSTINATGRITGAGFTSSSTISSSGNITVTRSGSEPTVKVDNETNSCSIMVGASTNNAGLYNHTKGAWDVYRDSSGALKMAGHTITGDTTCLVSGGTPYISVDNGTKKCGIHASTSNNRGLYDSTAGKWDIYRDSNDNLTVATCNIVSGSTIGGYTPLTSNNYNSYAATKGHNHREGCIGDKKSTTSYQKVNSTATNCKCFLVRISKSDVYFSTVVYIGTIGDDYTYGISVGTDYISFTCKLDSSGYFYIKRGVTPHYTFYVYGII